VSSSANADALMADLSAAFATRRCAICGGSVTVVAPGTDEERTQAVGMLPAVLTRAAIEDMNLCLDHAATLWPWPSEHIRTRRRSRSNAVR